MKAVRAALLAVTLVLALLLPTVQAESPSVASPEENPHEWTVLFYFCGSDLESKYGYASDNLEEFFWTVSPINFASQIVQESNLQTLVQPFVPGKVNVLVQTGGAKEWHAQKLGLDIDANSVQRWLYNDNAEENDEPHEFFSLVQTLPLQSMADPSTLSDFIRWGVETCPARKYVLVLWGHGNGAGSGLFIDELFDDDTLYLYELKQALADGGAHFETLVIDACLMANLETAWAVKDAANWMVASEEIVPGKGTAVGEWLQQLMGNPLGDGEWLGRCVCDTTGIKYANEADNIAKELLTWSVVDLSKIDHLVETTERLFSFIGSVMRQSPEVLFIYADFLQNAQEYGDGQQNMRELSSVVYDPLSQYFLDFGLRSDILQTLSEAVVYSLRGPGRSEARGLSFCYPVDFDSEELDIYAKNYPMPGYLAYLDAISPWRAPDSVYESVERLPEIDSVESYKLRVDKRTDTDGMPALLFHAENMNSLLNSVYYRLYRLDDETGEIVRLGRTICGSKVSDEGDSTYRASDPMHWPAIDGQLICMDLIQASYDHRLYNVPVQINSEYAILRCGRTITHDWNSDEHISDYEMLGVWEGFEEDNDLPSRSVKPLMMIEGQEYRLLYPTDAKDGRRRTTYQSSDTLTMYRAPEVQEIPLPPGTYYIEYEVEDIFLRSFLLERIEVQWDGAQMTFPDFDAWAGEATLN